MFDKIQFTTSIPLWRTILNLFLLEHEYYQIYIIVYSIFINDHFSIYNILFIINTSQKHWVPYGLVLQFICSCLRMDGSSRMGHNQMATFCSLNRLFGSLAQLDRSRLVVQHCVGDPKIKS